MPGWHNATEKLVEEGKLLNIGIVQEQHPARTQLFMQWKEMRWPVMVDALNLLGLEVVPVTLLVDEEGIIRFRGSEENLVKFLAQDPPQPMPKPRAVTAEAPRGAAPKGGAALLSHADGLFLWGGPDRLDDVVGAYSRAVAETPDSGPAHFRLGVAHRRRADSAHRQAGDFRLAVEHWGKALEINPNQYIWRRRIQQYGPRLDKPYPFYDWVKQARQDVEARGETPAALEVEPRGAELAFPSRDFATAGTEGLEPPIGAHRIHRDEEGLIHLETTVVPARFEPGSSARVHLSFRPNPSVHGHWNNEADDTEIWLETPEGWKLDQKRLTVSNPKALVSDEERAFELEVKSPPSADSTELNGFALYYVCEDKNGTCLYRRQDFSVPLVMR